MKKLSIFFVSLLALGFVSCDDHSDLGVMQTNPQEAFMSANGLTVDFGQALKGDQLNLADYESVVPVIEVIAAENLPANSNVAFKMELAADENYSNVVTLDVVDGAVAVADWDNAFRSLLGKAPFAKDNYVRFAAYVEEGTQSVRLGDANTYYAAKKVSVTPIDLNIQIEDAYYLLGTINGWDVKTAIKFSHSDMSVYDDPVFTLKVDIPAAEEGANQEWWWKIVPQSTYETGDWVSATNAAYGVEVNGSDALSGMLIGRPDAENDCGAGCLTVAGQYLMTINMLDCTYEFTQAIDYLYTPGNSNGWSFGDNCSRLFTNDYVNYNGFVYINGEYKLTDRPAWGGMEWAAGAEEGTIGLGASGNLPMPADGPSLYWMTANIANLQYTTTAISSISLIGDFNGWAGDVALTPSEDFLTWTGEVEFPGEGGWKFRCNNDWAVNLGGVANDNLVPNGDNLVAPGAGTYVVTLNLMTMPYSCTVEAK